MGVIVNQSIRSLWMDSAKDHWKTSLRRQFWILIKSAKKKAENRYWQVTDPENKSWGIWSTPPPTIIRGSWERWSIKRLHFPPIGKMNRFGHRNYQEKQWKILIDCWVSYNLHLAHGISSIPPEALGGTMWCGKLSLGHAEILGERLHSAYLAAFEAERRNSGK